MQYSTLLQGMQLWPSMVFFRLWPEFEQNREALIQSIQRLKATQTTSIESQIALAAKPNSGLYESHFDLFTLEIAPVQNLVRFIESSLKQAIQVAHSETRPMERLEIRFSDSWYHITTQGGFHDAHWHNDCSWCGIFYVELGEYQINANATPNGGSRFYCPIGQGGAYKDAGNRYLHPHYDPPLQEGLLFIFPSHLLHSGLPYFGLSDRIVIAFNAQAVLRP